MKKFLIIISFIGFSFTAAAQTKKSQVLAPTVAATSSTETALRIFLATELVSILEIEKSTTMSIEGVPIYLKQSIERHEKNPVVAQKTVAQVKARFDQLKTKLPQEMQSQYIKAFAKEYTSTELRYLIQIAKYPLYKKFKAYLESDAYTNIAGKPYTEAQKIVTETKRKIASESAPIKVNLGSNPVKVSGK